MKKFRSLLLSAVMLVSVCPLYGFTPAEPKGDEGKGKGRIIPEGEVETLLDFAIEAAKNAKEAFAPESWKQLEEDAIESEETARDYVGDAYDRRDEAEKKLKEYADNAETAANDAAKSEETAFKDLTDAWNAEIDAAQQENIAKSTWWFPVADQAAWRAWGDAASAGNSLTDALAQKEAADKAAATAKENYDAAQAEYDDAVNDIKEALKQGRINAEEAAAKTAEAEEKAVKVRDALEEANKAAETAKDEAETKWETAKDALSDAYDALKKAVENGSDRIKWQTAFTSGDGSALALSMAATEKALKIIEEYEGEERTEEIGKLNDQLDSIADTIEANIGKIEDTKVKAALLIVFAALKTPSEIKGEEIHIVNESEVAELHSESVKTLNTVVKESAQEVSKNVKAVSKAGVTAASARIAYDVAAATQALTGALYNEAANEAAAAIDANETAQAALEKAKALEKQGIKVSRKDLTRAKKASEAAAKSQEETEHYATHTNEAAKYAGIAAFQARMAAERLRPRG